MRASRALVEALVVWTLLGVSASAWAWLLPLWLGFGLALGVAILVDVRSLRGVVLAVDRKVSPALALGVWQRVELRIENAGARGYDLDVFDTFPDPHEAQDLPVAVRAQKNGFVSLAYRIRPTARGVFTFHGPEIVCHGRLGLVSTDLGIDVPSEVRVVPDFQKVAQFAVLALAQRVTALGIHLQRRRGEGLEFFQLREYRAGDALRQIDWKASSRRQKLTSKEYQLEQNQQILFLFDCGRRMRAKDGEIAHFDHALNALLLVTYVALREGDAVGLQTFAGEDRWLPPVRGRGGLPTVMQRVFDLQSTRDPSDFARAAELVWARQRRRALVILVTNLRDDDTADLASAVRLLERRHVVLVASLKETALEARIAAPVHTFDDALAVAGTHRYLLARERNLAAIRKGGVVVIDVEPAALPVRLVTEYLALKRAGTL